uniref:C2h2-type zn-finger protein n=1 Tax=Gongylonema pulchrum TaxID=637853 RepID=A0A183DPC2_9BILA
LRNTNHPHEHPETSHNVARAAQSPISSAGGNASVVRSPVRKEEPCQCPECGKQLRSTAGLHLHHLRYHSVEMSHVCSVCSRKCICKSELAQHMRVHSGERPYKCSVCSERFAHSGNRNRHMRKHTGEKLYTCEFCNISFSLLHSLKSHNKTHYRPAAMQTFSRHY